ncbi:transcriptional regulator [Xylella fastidiosa]|uniref:transcriptional regulator n=1 Tax=Xylella fastidiosa TaxID=2371 RepID=UPI0039849EAA
MNAIDIAVKEFGSVNALAASLGVRQSAISNWRARGRVPAERCIVIERVTNGAVSRYQLRPDIFGTPHKSQAGGARCSVRKKYFALCRQMAYRT